MPSVNPLCYHISASSVSAFKKCPQLFRLSYREGLRLAADTDSQRMGTNWHKIHELYSQAFRDSVQDIPHDEAEAKEYALNVVVLHLNEAYAVVPPTKTNEEWAAERQVLLMSFLGYLWRWQNDPVEVLASEVPFELPLREPRTGMNMPISEVARVGKIDHIIKWQGAVCALERKSTSRSIAFDSDYWDKAKKDTQISMYALAFRDMKTAEYLTHAVLELVGSGGKLEFRAGNTLYDVWHKPTIKPAMLTQAATAAFMDSHEYEGMKFAVETEPQERYEWVPATINGVKPLIEEGKKGFAIRETPEMFGARLLQDIYKRPDFYFQRREIARTVDEIQQFEKQLWAVYQSQKMMEKGNTWFENESACRATFPCPYIAVCFGEGADHFCGPSAPTPAGFKRVFTQLTHDGKPIVEDD